MDSRKRILVVDDEAPIRRVLELKLKNGGYEVFLAEDGEAALRIIESEKPDAMITDINMPRMDGYEFTRKVRSVQETSRLPIIMVTSDVKSADRNKAFDVGINEFLAKPFSEDDLRAAIEKHLRVF